MQFDLELFSSCLPTIVGIDSRSHKRKGSQDLNRLGMTRFFFFWPSSTAEFGIWIDMLTPSMPIASGTSP